MVFKQGACGHAIRGAMLIEYIVAFPALLIVVLGVWQTINLVNAHGVVTMAAFNAARVGSASGVDMEKMKSQFALSIAPLTAESQEIGLASVSAIPSYLLNRNILTHIAILNPTQASFADFGWDNNVGDHGDNNIERILPYRETQVRDFSTVEKHSKQTELHANILRIRVTYCASLDIPIVSTLFVSAVSLFDKQSFSVSCLLIDRFPLTAIVTMHMQSSAVQSRQMLR